MEDFENQFINRKREVQRQWEELKFIRQSITRYKEIETNGRIPEYLRKENLGEGKRSESLQIKV